MKTKKLPQTQIIKFHEAGIVMANYNTTAFKFLGNYYSTNKRRKKTYKFDDTNWRLDLDKGTFWKLQMLITGKANRLR